MASTGDLALRLLLAAALGGLLGAERELTEQPAGMRTHMLVAVGAALFAIVSGYGFESITSSAHAPGDVVHVDVSRVAAGIVSGIGFLGAGAILKYGASIRGLTTAASLWITAAIGTAVGVGMRVEAVVAVGIVLFALVGLRPLRRVLRRHTLARHELIVETEPQADLPAILAHIEEQAGAAVSEIRTGHRGSKTTYLLVAHLPRRAAMSSIAARVADGAGIREVDWS
jgi:putative Mg2+ transporter-C (MgtC) family protein